MTIVVNCEEHPLEQVTKQLNKLINVLKIVELEPGASVQRELILIKVRADAESRSRVLETVALFRAKVVDVAPGRGHRRGHREPRQARRPDQGARAVRDQGAGAVRHGRPRPRRPLHHRPGAAAGGPCTRSGPVTSAHDIRRQHRSTRGKSQWQRSSTTTAPTCPSSSAGTWPCSGTAARGTPTRCRCGTPAWTSGSGCRRDPRAGRRPASDGLRVVTPGEACEEADLIMVLVPDHCSAPCTPRPSRRAWSRATRCSSRTA